MGVRVQLRGMRGMKHVPRMGDGGMGASIVSSWWPNMMKEGGGEDGGEKRVRG